MTTTATPSTPPFLAIQDEMWYYFNDSSDVLSRELRELPFVPNATYKVVDDRVFVFAKLVADVKKARQLPNPESAAALAKQYLPSSFVSPQEAVDVWSIIPYPYYVNQLPSGVSEICHLEFDARIPVEFADQETLNQALVAILMGGVIPAPGSFSYAEQSFNFLEPLSSSSLPVKPSCHAPAITDDSVSLPYLYPEYQAGFEPLTEHEFNTITGLSQKEDYYFERVRATIRQNEARVFQLTGQLLAADSTLPSGELAEYADQDDLHQLRKLYPEFQCLSDCALYESYDSYQVMDCRCNGWTPYRDVDFCEYLLRELVNRRVPAAALADKSAIRYSGTWLVYALLQGDSMEAAVEFALAAHRYHQAVYSLASRARRIMHFLTEAHTKPQGQGGPVITLLDGIYACRSNRKYSVGITEVEQGE